MRSIVGLDSFKSVTGKLQILNRIVIPHSRPSLWRKSQSCQTPAETAVQAVGVLLHHPIHLLDPRTKLFRFLALTQDCQYRPVERESVMLGIEFEDPRKCSFRFLSREQIIVRY